MTRTAFRFVAVIAAGLLLGVAFPPVGAWWLAPVAVAVLTVATYGTGLRIGALLGLASGWAFFLVLLQWLRVVGVDAWIGLALLEALFWLVLGAGIALLTRTRWWPLSCAALWVLVELLRAHLPLGGFPWGRLAFASADNPAAAFASLGGPALVTFVVGSSGSLLAWAWVTRGRRARPHRVAAVAGAVAVLLAGSAIPVARGGSPGERETLTVAIVQGNVPRLGLDFLGQRKAVLTNHVDGTHELARRIGSGDAPVPDFVVWPENASDIDPFRDRDGFAAIQGAVDAVGVPVLVGTLVDSEDRTEVENSGIVWDPASGPGQRYVKRHPVPFGEYVPFRDVLDGWIERLDEIPRDFARGDSPGVLDIDGTTVGLVICFEIAYDSLVRDVVRGGGEVLVVQTNNATYGRTGQPEQQFAISRLRAIEHGRAVVVASTSGISGIIEPDGHVALRSAEFTRDLMTGQVRTSDSTTVADRLGAWPEWVLAALAITAMVLAARRSRGTPE